MAESKAERNIYQRSDGKWAWRLYGDNGSDIVATDGGQGYENEDDCRTIANQVTSGHYKDCKKTITRPKES